MPPSYHTFILLFYYHHHIYYEPWGCQKFISLCFVLFGSFVQEVTIEDQKPDLNEPAIEYYVEIKGDEVPSKLELESALASISEKDTKPVIIQKSTNIVHTAVVQGDLLRDIVNYSGTA